MKPTKLSKLSKFSKLLQTLPLIVFIYFWQITTGHCVPAPVKNLPNGCVIVGLYKQHEVLKGVDLDAPRTAQKYLNKITWARLYRIGFKDNTGHCLCIFTDNSGNLWAYDRYNGSTRLETKNKSSESILLGVKKYLKDYNSKIISGGYLD